MTVGVNVQTKKSPIGNQDSELFIFSDIAGQSQFLNLRKSYYAGIEIVLAVFDLTRKESLTNLENIWIPEFLNSNPLEEGLRTKIQLVGNKSDLKDSIEVTYADMEACVSRIMKRFSQTSFLRPFLMTSAKNNLYINQAFGYS
jgi:GTPase SAR1 family protein